MVVMMVIRSGRKRNMKDGFGDSDRGGMDGDWEGLYMTNTSDW